MRRYFHNLGSIGIIADTEPRQLSAEAWTEGGNVRFVDNKVVSMRGHEEVFASPLYEPWFLQPLRKNDDYFWFYASQNDIGVTDGTNHATVSETSGGYSTSLDTNWTSATLPGGVLVLNNGSEPPQQWTGSSISDTFANLSSWPASTVCNVLRSVGNFLVAMDVTESSIRTPELVRWSTRADPGSVPSSWDYTDPTQRAGRTALRTPGPIVDAFILRESLAIYQEQHVTIMSEIGGNNVFQFRPILSQIGALNRNCVGQMRNHHVVFSFDDLIMHDGVSVRSIADRRVRRNLFNSIDGANYERSFLAINYAQNEVWFCYPTSGATYCTQAWIWNWVYDTWTKRDLPNVAHAAHGVINTQASQQFDDSTGDFDIEPGIFDEGNLTGAQLGFMLGDSTNTKLFQADKTNRFDTEDVRAYVQREALPLGVDDQFDLNKVKFIREIIPYVTGTEGGELEVYIGTRDSLEDGTLWNGPFVYTIGTSHKLDMRISGRIIDIRFESDANIEWELTGYRVEYRIQGQR